MNAVEMDVRNQHVAAAMSNLVMELADYVIQKRRGNFTDEEMDANEDTDRVEDYARLEPEVRAGQILFYALLPKQICTVTSVTFRILLSSSLI